MVSPHVPKFIKGFCALFLLIQLEACTTIDQPRTAEEYTQNRKNDGLVIASAVINSNEVAGINFISLERLDDQGPTKWYVFPNQVNGVSRDQGFFAGSVPAGPYRVDAIHFLPKKNVSTTYIKFDKSSLPGPLMVQPGQTTDLGMMLVTAVDSQVSAVRSTFYPDSKTLAAHYFKGDKSLVQNSVEGWHLSRTDDELEVEIYAQDHPQAIDAFYETRERRLLAGARMGTILERTPQGRWQIAARLGTYEGVAALAQLPGSQGLLAITYRGQGFMVKDNKSQLLPMILPAGDILFLKHSDDFSTWLLGVEKEDWGLQLYKTNNVLNGSWELLTSFKSRVDSYVEKDRQSFAFNLPGQFVFSAMNQKKLYCFDYATQKGTLVDAPYMAILDMNANPVTGDISVMAGPGFGLTGVSASSYSSGHCAGPWKKVEVPYTAQVAAPIFTSKQHRLVMGGMLGDEGMYGSADGGETWRKYNNDAVISVTGIYGLSEKTVVTRYNGVFRISEGSNGITKISQSQDHGLSWKTEVGDE